MTSARSEPAGLDRMREEIASIPSRLYKYVSLEGCLLERVATNIEMPNHPRGRLDLTGEVYLSSNSFRVCSTRSPVTAAASSLYRYTPDANRLPATSRPSHRRA